MYINISELSKSFGETHALKSINFSIMKNEFLSFIGPSGSGKTTLLKILAGIENSDKGLIYYPESFSGKKILVFQEYLLFPHMSVFENVAFGLKAGGLNKKYVQKKVRYYLSLFKIADKENCYPSELSGGQKQRAVIARAMILEPSLLLLDEPFANLDRNLKAETAGFIHDMQKKLKTTTVCVTHDLDEAFAVSDRIGILIEGELLQISRTKELYYDPIPEKAAAFMGHYNKIPSCLYRKMGIESERPELWLRSSNFLIEKNIRGEGIVSEISYETNSIIYKVNINNIEWYIASQQSDFSPGDRVDITLNHGFKSRNNIFQNSTEAL